VLLDRAHRACHTLTSAGREGSKGSLSFISGDPLRIDDFNTYQLPISFLDLDLARAADQMVEPLKSHFDQNRPLES